METKPVRTERPLLRTDFAPQRWMRGGALMIVLLVSITAALPLFWYGIPKAFDTPIHLARLGALDAAISQGEFYPRWLPNLLLGHGYPLFNYYAPSAYYVATTILRLGANAGYAYLIAYALFLLVAGVGMYRWARDLYDQRSAATLAATAYVFAPYLLLNTYVRGSFAETCAIALLPWTFWAFRRLMVAARPMRLVPLAAFTLGALAVSHNITLLLTPPVLLAYLLVLGYQGGLVRANMRAVMVSLLLAMGVSAFFWLPLILERGLLSDAAYEIARNGYLPGNVWQWDNFLQRSLTYIYNDNDAPGPVQLSIVQCALAALGFAMALLATRRTSHARTLHTRTRRAELWLLLGVLVGAGLCVGAWALPVWQSNRIFAVVQFPWRLLVIMGLPLAMAVGGFASAVSSRALRMGVGLAVLALIMWAHYPRLALISFYDPTSVAITLDHVAKIEQYKGAEEGGENTSSVQEFKPRWAARTLVWDAASDTVPGAAAAPLDIEVVRASGWQREVVVEAAQATHLRFNQFYFPGWHAQLNQADATLYPSSNLGLLTIDLPAGSHHITLTWRGTWIERSGGWITLLALLALAMWCWRQRLRRGWLGVTLLLLGMALVATFYQPPPEAVASPTEKLAGAGMTLVGVRVAHNTPDALDLQPTWYVDAPLPDDLALHWQVVDAAGDVVADWVGQPFYNSYGAANFPPQTVVDDAYRLPLPGGLAPGSYGLRGQIMVDARALSPLVDIGKITLHEATPARHMPQVATTAHFEEGITLMGYDAHTPSYLGDQAVVSDLPVMASGGQIELTLWWQAYPSPHENYHGFVHLVDSHGMPIEQVDQLPGPVFQSPMLWNGIRATPDVYDLYIPAAAPSGLYWPWVGLYRYPSGNRLRVVDADGTLADADHVQLGPIKIVNQETAPEPTTVVDVAMGDFAKWIGYDGPRANTSVAPGESVTVTLVYQSIAPTDVDYTRFVHVVHADAGLVTQADAVPQDGANPTWAWQPGEVIVDPLTITFPPDAPAGDYEVLLGFYAPDQDGARAPLSSAEAGRVLGGEQALLVRVTVAP